MNNNPKPQVIVWWILWMSFLIGVFMIYHFIGQNIKEPASSESLTWLAAVVPAFVSIVIRWQLLPRIGTAQVALQVFIIGLALAESACFMGLFIFPGHKQTLFLLSVLGIVQFIPVFAARYYDTK